MNPVANYDNLLQVLDKKCVDGIVCILILNPANNSDSQRQILHNFNYLHERSGKEVNFYVPGFSVFEWDSLSVDYEFSSKDFVKFVNVLEKKSLWQYSGGTEMLFLNYRNRDLQFDEVLDLKLDRMLVDGLIFSIDEFFEEIIRSLKNNEFMEDIEVTKINHMAGSAWSVFKEFLPKKINALIKVVGKVNAIHQHLSLKNYSI